MTLMHNESTVTVNELSEEDAHELFDAACKRELQVSADEFLAAYDSDELPSEWSAEAVSRVEFLLPFVR